MFVQCWGKLGRPQLGFKPWHSSSLLSTLPNRNNSSATENWYDQFRAAGHLLVSSPPDPLVQSMQWWPVLCRKRGVTQGLSIPRHDHS